MNTWDTDRDYTEASVTRVRELGDHGWIVSMQSVHAFFGRHHRAVTFVPAEECKVAPSAGERVRAWGEEREPRGLVIEGRCYYYRTAEQMAELKREGERARRAIRHNRLAEERSSRDARRWLLPAALRRRLDEMQGRGGGEDWRRDIEGFELDVSELAARAAARYAGNLEGLGAFIDDTARDEQLRILYGSERGAGHRLEAEPNGWACAMTLAGFLVGDAAGATRASHSGACTVMGCRRCGCMAVEGRERIEADREVMAGLESVGAYQAANPAREGHSYDWTIARLLETFATVHEGDGRDGIDREGEDGSKAVSMLRAVALLDRIEAATGKARAEP